MLLAGDTVDLLLTIDRYTVPLPLVEGMTRRNTSTGQRPLALDRLSQAPFATQSATQFDLARASRIVLPLSSRRPGRLAQS